MSKNSGDFFIMSIFGIWMVLCSFIAAE